MKKLSMVVLGLVVSVSAFAQTRHRRAVEADATPELKETHIQCEMTLKYKVAGRVVEIERVHSDEHHDEIPIISVGSIEEPTKVEASTVRTFNPEVITDYTSIGARNQLKSKCVEAFASVARPVFMKETAMEKVNVYTDWDEFARDIAESASRKTIFKEKLLLSQNPLSKELTPIYLRGEEVNEFCIQAARDPAITRCEKSL